MQYVVDTLIAMPGLKALVANVEMPATALLDRQLARISEISLSRIRRREFNSDEPMIISAIQTLTGVGDQLAFFEGKFSVDNVASAASSFGAQMVVLDYLQRFTADGEHTSQRDAVSAIMQQLRRWATAGAAVLVASAVSRTRDRQGNSYAGLGLASFRESSEIEFGADNCFIIEPTRNGPRNLIQLSHVKSRYTEPCNMVLMFDGQLQRFSEVMPGTDALPVGSTQTELQAQAAAAWEGSNGDQ
jgi:replicative DNA helicase